MCSRNHACLCGHVLRVHVGTHNADAPKGRHDFCLTARAHLSSPFMLCPVHDSDISGELCHPGGHLLALVRA